MLLIGGKNTIMREAFMNCWIISHPKDVYLGQGEKIKKIREIIQQKSINKRIFANKTIKYPSK